MRDQVALEFLVEADALIEALFDEVESLRAHYRDGHARRDLIARIFRRVHTIKGTASAAELEAVAMIAHEFESLLDSARRGKISVDEQVIDAFEDGASAISQAITAEINGHENPGQPDLIHNLRALSHAIESPVVDWTAALTSALPGDIGSALGEQEFYRLSEAIGEAANLFLVTAGFDLASCDVSFRKLSEELTSAGDVITAVPRMDPASVEQISFTILFAASLGKNEVEALTSAFSVVTVTAVKLPAQKIAGTRPEQHSQSGLPGDSEHPALTDSYNTTVRVRLAALDEIISSSHDILREIKGVLDLTLSSSVLDGHKDKVMAGSELVRSRFSQLEERLIGLRMVRAEHLLERARRAGRIAARATGKAIEFEVFGGQVRLDKMVEEALLISLMHLVRNAVDHGIETADERHNSGKLTTGKVSIEAVAEGTRVRFRVVDDGRGINPAQVATMAIQRGIIPEGSVINMEQSLRLIFHPGFSTASGVSNISGRGVGLDVVERSVEQAGGEVKVFSEAGRGTTFEMLMSMPLALVPSTVLLSGDQHYCIEKSRIEALIATEPREIAGEQCVEWQRELLPFIEMSRLMDHTVAEVAAPKRHAVIVNLNDFIVPRRKPDSKRFAIGVDSFGGSHEALIWSLGRHASRWHGISGATELSDGSIALLLDVSSALPEHFMIRQFDRPNETKKG